MDLFKPDISKLEENRDVKGLIKALGYTKDAGVRLGAAAALGELGDPLAVDPLIAALQDADPAVCRAAVEALGGLRAQPALQPLAALLRAPRADLRPSLERALAGFGSPAVKPLLEVLKDNDKNVRQAAVEVIVAIGSPAVEPLSSFLRNTDWLKGELITEALGRIGGGTALSALTAALKNQDSAIRFNAAAVLGRFADAGAFPALLDALNDPVTTVRTSAAEALRRLGWKPARDAVGARQAILIRDWGQCPAIGAPAVEPLIQFLQDKSSKAVDIVEAVEALAKVRDPEAVPLLIDALGNGNDQVRRGAAGALGAMRVTQAVEPLLLLLGDKDGGVSKAAAAALVRIGDASLLQVLPPMLEAANADARARAAEVLEKLGWKPSTPEAQVHLLINQKDWDGCIRLGKPAIPALIALLLDRHASNSASAAVTLGRLADPAAADALASALSDKRTAVSQAAVDALLSLGAPAVRPLQDLLRSPRRSLRELAASLLDRLGWQPQTRADAAWYACAKKDWEKCRSLKAAAVEPLLLFLEAEDRKLRWDAESAQLRLAAVESLGAIADARAVEALIRTLSEPWLDLQVASARALGAIGDPRAVDDLMKFGGSGNDELHASEAIQALGAIGGPHAAGCLFSLISSTDQKEYVIKAAGAALERIGWKAASPLEQAWFLISRGKWDQVVALGNDAVEPLQRILRSYWSYPESHQAADALGRINPAGAVAVLLPLLKVTAFEMRQAAARALVELYRGSGITPAEKQLILEQRDFIKQPHADSPHVDIYETCTFAPHGDSGGAQVKFPL